MKVCLLLPFICQMNCLLNDGVGKRKSTMDIFSCRRQDKPKKDAGEDPVPGLVSKGCRIPSRGGCDQKQVELTSLEE